MKAFSPAEESRPVACYANLAGLRVGDGQPVRVVGVINVSPESFYKGSVVTVASDIAERAATIVREGAEIIDVGARSTAPYLETEVPLEEEARRLKEAVKIIKGSVRTLVSADTTRASLAEAAINAGADIVNDVQGLKGDAGMVEVVAEYQVPLIVAAHEPRPGRGGPVRRVTSALKDSLKLVSQASIDPTSVVLDPAIGFFRSSRIPWHVWDCEVIRSLSILRGLQRPILVGVSRKSFIGQITGVKEPVDRLYGSLAAAAVAVFQGAHMIRTHDVLPTVHAVKVAKAILEASRAS